MNDSEHDHAHGHSHAHAHAHSHAPGSSGPSLAEIVPTLALPASPRVAVDIGCGAGDDARLLHDLGFAAIGVDANPEALHVAAERTPEGVTIGWVEARASQLPMHDESCVLVTDRGCMHHLPSDERLVYAGEVARVLAHGGAWVLRDLVGHHGQVDELDERSITSLATMTTLHVERCNVTDSGDGHRWLVAVLRQA